MTPDRLTKLDVLLYALEGACTYRGIHSGALSDAEAEQVDADIAERQRRVTLAKLAPTHKEA